MGISGDVIDISSLLEGYQAGISDVNDFVNIRAMNNVKHARIDIDVNGDRMGVDVAITLDNTAFNSTMLDDMLASGNLIL